MIYDETTRIEAVRLAREGVEYCEIGARLGPSQSTIRVWARAADVPPRSTRHTVPYFPEETRELARRLRAEGRSVREVMAATGASHDAVWRWTRRAA